MKLVIDLRNKGFNHNELGVFTYEFWEDITSFQPGHEFMVITPEKMAGWPARNTHIIHLKKTGVPWLDAIKFKKKMAAYQPDRLVTIREAGFTISVFINNAPAVVKEVVFAGSQTGAQAAFPVAEIPVAVRQEIPALTWAASESIKTRYTAGRSFFLFTGDISERHRLIDLLKAFSAFKKWQQSNMQLVIAGSTTAWTNTFEEKLSAYKYKHDVTVLKNISNNEIADLTAAAYAMVYPVAGDVFPLALVWAMQGHKAVIATDNPVNRRLTNAAAWVEDSNTAEGFAKAMILLYKDEKQQQLLVQQTKEPGAQYSRQQMLDMAWQCICG